MTTVCLREAVLTKSRHSLLLRLLASAFIGLLTSLPLVQARAQETPERSSREPSVQSRGSHYPIGTAVQVHLRNKEIISGRIEKYADDGFWVRAEGQSARKDRKIFFFEMQSINPAKHGGGKGTADQPRISVDMSVGGTGATVRVYRPNAAEDSDEPH